MSFHLYPRLPMELRLQVVEEAVATRVKQAGHTKAALASWAGSIHSEWNGVVEGVLFKSIITGFHELQMFAGICGKRQSLLRKVIFSVWLQHPLVQPDQHQEVMDVVSQLFFALKDWSPSERPGHLIKLYLPIPTDPRQDTMSSFINSCDFTNLPQVPAIGRIFIAPSPYLRWSHSSTHALQKKLPNLRSAQLALPNTLNEGQAIARSRIRIVACHQVNPNLTKLNISQDKILGFDPMPHQRTRRGAEIRIARAVSPQLSLWHNTLVSLKLNCSVDPAQFLLMASASLWPNLRRLELAGTVDDEDFDHVRAWGSEVRADGDLLRGLIACLPNMPSLMSLSMRFMRYWTRRLRIDFGTGIRTDSEVLHNSHFAKAPVTPCAPLAANSGIVKTYELTLPGPLVTQLQDTVWRVRGMELAVFRCSDHCYFHSFHPPCAQWNSKTDAWEPAFFNDMDEFIYIMGEYFRQINI